MVKAYYKTIFRTIKNNLSRFLSMIAIVALGVGFVTGLSATAPNMKDSINKYYYDNNVSDIFIKSSSVFGITNEQILIIQNNELISNVESFFTFDITINDNSDKLDTRLYYLPLQTQTLNKITLFEGDWPKQKNEILVERSSQNIKKRSIGDIITYNGEVLKIVGIASNPLYFSTQKIRSINENEYLETIIYFDNEINFAPSIITDLYIKLFDVTKNRFTSEYEQKINKQITNLKQNNKLDSLVFMTIEENESFALFKTNIDKIETISFIFPFFFIFIAALVILTTMTRLIEEERTIIGCYKTLGYGNVKIVFKYLFYAMLCGIIGSIIGIIGGFKLIPKLINSTFINMFNMPPLTNGFFYLFGIITAIIMLLSLFAVTLYVAIKSVRENPALLLRPKAPKKGKKIFLERMDFIWKHLKFKYKSTFRNVFRYIKHFIMTVTSIAGCMALVLAGLGLYDSIDGTDLTQFSDPSLIKGIINSVLSISIILIVCAAVLSIVVIYNITNMNIEERKKEIATLMVLGYKDKEVVGYIYREIFTLSCFGIIIGLPLGYILLKFVLNYMDSQAFRLILNINWYSWILSVVLTVLFIVMVDVMLYRKIIKIDMNASLKAND